MRRLSSTGFLINENELRMKLQRQEDRLTLSFIQNFQGSIRFLPPDLLNLKPRRRFRDPHSYARRRRGMAQFLSDRLGNNDAAVEFRQDGGLSD